MDYNASFAMSPKLIHVGSSCFRRLDCDPDGIIENLTINHRTIASKNIISQSGHGHTKNYSIDQLESDDCIVSAINNDDGDYQFGDGEGLRFDEKSKRFILTLHLCNTFFGYLIGKKGQTKMNIESETMTSLKIPKLNQNDSQNYIQVQGVNKSNVLQAFKRIRDLEHSSRLKQSLTHFISIPLSFKPEIKKQFLNFKTAILSDPKLSITKSIDESVFQSEHRLHLTLRILYLGIDIMNDDPSEANVVYAKVFEVGQQDLFRQIVNKLYDCFSRSGLECEADRYELNNEWKVKIHCTLMNTRYRDKNDQHDGKERKSRSKMNVGNILEKFADYDFGLVPLSEIHLSAVDFYDERNHYYLPLNKIYF
ncbi:activating signal cointegrator 1 complex subunit [Dermatophagoides pteronyssinus]|uniref:Activating signal cointegrator 1 complex subunit n=1 Tax=Dermatophagoides pteronyssinus TaxID=6956 RepID=A0ABQ8JEH9_DERPT|nr:activating signal cointegrator 1 complex subunit [Dermatophagoides pteronyssinus]